MADNENLVSQITVTGGNEAAAEIQAFADTGSAAFQKLDQSVNKSAADIESSANRIGTAGGKAAAGVAAAGAAAPAAASKMDIFKTGLKNVEDAFGNLTAKIPQLTQAIGRFSQRMAVAGAGVAAAGVKIATAASNVASKVGSSTNAFEQNANAQIRANDSALQSQIGAINLASSQSQLFRQLQRGKITYEQYREQLTDLNDQYNEQIRVARQVEIAQEEVRKENEALKKSVEDRKAFSALVDQFGGPLVSSLAQFGNQVNQVHSDFVQAFSPAAGALVDQIGQAFSRNSGNINAFFQNASTKLQALVQNNGPALQKFFDNIGSAAASVFNGIIAAAPGVIDFVNNKLAPAFAKLASLLTTVANAVNFIFGTNFTAGGLVAVAIIGQLTGSFKLLFTIIKLGGGITNGLFKVIGEGALTASKLVGGGKLADGLIKFGTAAVTSGGLFKTFFAIIRTGIPLIITLVEIVGTALGVSFGVALPIVVALGAALYFIIKNVDWKAFGAAAVSALASIFGFLARLAGGFGIIGDNIRSALNTAWESIKAAASATVQFIQSAWTGIVSFFSDLGNGIGSALSATWDAIVSAAQSAAQQVQDGWNAIVAFFSDLGQQISDALGAVWQGIQDGFGAAVQFVTDTWNALVQFFQSMPGTLQAVWDAIKTNITTAFQAAWDAIKASALSFVNTVKSYLQPIIDLINTIKDGISSALGGGDGGPPGFATGGSPNGHIRGPGTSTSDSILARLSNNEFVMRAKAVAKYGVGFMHAVNTGQFNLPQFNFGGFIAPSPVRRVAFAEGGQVRTGGNLQPLNLTIGQDTFEGILMPEEVGNKLTKYAVSRQNRSAGRKPAWIGNRRN